MESFEALTTSGGHDFIIFFLVPKASWANATIILFSSCIGTSGEGSREKVAPHCLKDSNSFIENVAIFLNVNFVPSDHCYSASTSVLILC